MSNLNGQTRSEKFHFIQALKLHRAVKETFSLCTQLEIYMMYAIFTCSCVDLRTGAFDVPPQEILTRDSVTVTVDAVVYYQVYIPGIPLVKSLP